MTEIPSVDELISESRNEKKLNRKRKLVKVLLTLIGLSIFCFSIYFYFINPISNLSKVNVYGNNTINELYLKESVLNSGSHYSILDFGFTLTEELESNPLIKSVHLDYINTSELNITIEENGVLEIGRAHV